jgi:acid phosphatase type 7
VSRWRFPSAVHTLLAAALLLAPLPASAASLAGTGGAETVTLVGAGDIAVCGTERDSATAALVQDVLNSDPTAIAFTSGDNAYPDGSPEDFNNCYEPTWGVFKARTRPTPGNHDYLTPGAAGYFAYFGRRAGPEGRGWYKILAGTWRVYMMTSECPVDSSCFRKQLRWLKADLRNNPRECTMAVWHRPLFSTGEHGNSVRMRQVFSVLYNRGAELVINGHDHGYQRFKPADAMGIEDPTRGIREFVVATGGASLYAFETDSALLEARDNTSHGVLKLTLAAGSYSWEFIPVPGKTFTDTGSADCH